MPQNGCCLYCKCAFLRSPYRPQQTVCSRPECQRRRCADYHRRKLEADPEYRQIAHDSQKKWREAHPDYLPHYRAEHPEAVERNRKRQQWRDQKRRILSQIQLVFRRETAENFAHSDQIELPVTFS